MIDTNKLMAYLDQQIAETERAIGNQDSIYRRIHLQNELDALRRVRAWVVEQLLDEGKDLA
jgi:hypothetical protein